MEVNRVIPSGFCEGVARAIKMAKDARSKYPDDDIYIIGHLVHNHLISDSLAFLNIKTLDDKDKTKEELIEEIDEGVVIFSAHGIADKIKDKALNKGLIVIDATCPFVLKTKDIIKEYLAKDYTILYIGKDKHPEAMAILSISPKIKLIQNKEDIDRLDRDLKVFATNQTTMSIHEVKDIYDKIKSYFKDAIISDEICNATRSRQEAIIKLEDVDLLYVVGDPMSNNTNKLKDIALDHGIKKVRLIKSARDIDISDLNGVDNIYVTSGASTPNYLREEVIKTLKAYDETGKLSLSPLDLSKLI